MKNIKRSVKLYVGKLKWHLLKINEPVSRKFGYDRGTPIDRVYIEDFLRKNSKYIRGVVCEIGDSTYTVKFGSDVERFEVLDYINDNQRATLIADLTDINKLPRDRFDCFIVTQTLNVIYDFKKAIYGIYYTLKDNGVALVTVPGICQISRGDYNKWGDYWRFTDLSISRAFEEVFGKNNVEVQTYGNVISATAFLYGISAEELTKDEIFYKDHDYQVTIALKAVKRLSNNV